MKRIINWPFLMLIRAYQRFMRPVLPPSCIYTPGCSTYMYQAIEKYGFLKGGCSKDPLDLLRGAGVDMEKPHAVNAAMKLFGELVDELDSLL